MIPDPGVFHGHTCSLYCEGAIHAELLTLHTMFTTPEAVTVVVESAILELKVLRCRPAPEADLHAVWRKAEYSQMADGQIVPITEGLCAPDDHAVWLVWYTAVDLDEG